jgi:hypothetical protein
VDEHLLLAYADGQLEGKELARVEAAVRKHPALQRRVALYKATACSSLQPHYADILTRPVPQRLLTAVERGGPVRPAPAAVPARTTWRNWLSRGHCDWLNAAAYAAPAGVALAFVFAVGTTRPQPDPFRIVMEATQSGTTVAFASSDGVRSLTPVLTFRTADGRYCRRYDLERAAGASTAGIACRDDTGIWRIVLEEDTVLRKPPEGMTTAGSGDAVALDAKLAEMMSSDALGREDEDAALRSGWRR